MGFSFIGPNANDPRLADVRRDDDIIVQVPIEFVKSLAPAAEKPPAEGELAGLVKPTAAEAPRPGGQSAGPQTAQVRSSQVREAGQPARAGTAKDAAPAPVAAPPPTPGVSVADAAPEQAPAQAPAAAPVPETAADSAAAVVQERATIEAAARAQGIPVPGPARTVGEGAPGKVTTTTAATEINIPAGPEGAEDRKIVADARKVQLDANRARQKLNNDRIADSLGLATRLKTANELTDEDLAGVDEDTRRLIRENADEYDAQAQRTFDVRTRAQAKPKLKDQTFGQRFASALAIIAGGFAQSLRRAGGVQDPKNEILEGILAEIDRDIELQQKEIDNAQGQLPAEINALGRVSADRNDILANQTGLKQAVLDDLSRQTKAAITQAQTVAQQRELQEFNLSLDQKIAQVEIDAVTARRGTRAVQEVRQQRVGRRTVRGREDPRFTALRERIEGRRDAQAKQLGSLEQIQARSAVAVQTARAKATARGEAFNPAAARDLTEKLTAVGVVMASTNRIRKQLIDGLPSGAGPLEGTITNLTPDALLKLQPRGQFDAALELDQNMEKVVADYVRAVSGAQASDLEVKRLRRATGLNRNSTIEQIETGLRMLETDADIAKRNALAGTPVATKEEVIARIEASLGRELPEGVEARGNVQ